jgi:CheY-like chemotaxis protein
MTCILLTEDQSDQRTLYHEVLTEAGYIVYAAASAEEAFELYERCKPDLVILDIQMPGVDGIDVLTRIVSMGRKTPVILYSAYPAFKANFMSWPADAFVEKTGNPQELLDAVRKLSRERGIAIPLPLVPC